MTNKSELVSVPRELLERAIKAIDKHHSSLAWDISSELKTFSVASAKDVRAVGDEPVAYFTFCHDKNKWVQGKPKGPEFIHLFTPLYCRPRRQVALPEREFYTQYILGVIPNNAEQVNAYKDGWNACLDEIERLNK